jgi:hypothetical protein
MLLRVELGYITKGSLGPKDVEGSGASRFCFEYIVILPLDFKYSHKIFTSRS